MTKRTKILRSIILVLSIVVMITITILISKPLLACVEDPEALKTWIDGMGIWGPILFMLLNMVQVFLAVIPGGPFEIAAGYAFGIVPGTLMCLVAMSIAGVINFLLIRKFGMAFAEIFTTREKIESVRFLKSSNQKNLLLFLFFLIPGTPKDLMCYAVGFTDIKLWIWTLINFFGRLPGVLVTVMSGSALGEQNYKIFVIIMVAIVVCALAGILLYNVINKKKEPKH